jgi:hypothetical protein
MNYKTVGGEEKIIGEHGKSTQREFDEALAALPGLITEARNGNEDAGSTANSLLWQLANESFNTRTTTDFTQRFLFGREPVAPCGLPIEPGMCEGCTHPEDCRPC